MPRRNHVAGPARHWARHVCDVSHNVRRVTREILDTCAWDVVSERTLHPRRKVMSGPGAGAELPRILTGTVPDFDVGLLQTSSTSNPRTSRSPSRSVSSGASRWRTTATTSTRNSRGWAWPWSTSRPSEDPPARQYADSDVEAERGSIVCDHPVALHAV